MLKFVVVLHRKPGASREQFRRYLEDVHGPMAEAIPGLRRYVQNHVREDASRDDPGWDAVIELYWDDRDAMERGWQSATWDESGNVVARYLWDAWGNLRNQDALNASQNRIGYTGHRFDEESGLHHAQTRHIDPTIGRFTIQDTYLGEVDDPASQNRFAYAQGNPTKYDDPTGGFAFLVPILIGVIAAELDIIHQEVTQGKELFTLDPSKGIDAGKAAKSGVIAAAATATGQILAGGALAGTGALARWSPGR
jgi:uncharacterized protein (TIGR02118 family)